MTAQTGATRAGLATAVSPRLRLARPRRAAVVPEVTVVVPCYNYGHYLPDVVRSVLDQDRVAARVVVVDDASPDGSVEVARRLAREDPRVDVVEHEVNQRHIATYNDGLARVDTEYVSLVSADDRLPAGALARATDLMTAFPRVGMVYGMTRFFTDQVPRTPQRVPVWTVWSGHQWISLACRTGRNFVMSPEVVMRTDALREVGGYNPALPHSGDLEFWLRTATTWDVGRVNHAVQALYRVHDSNMHVTTYNTMPLDIRHRRAAFDVLVGDWVSSRLPRAEAHHRRAYVALAREALRLAVRHVDSGADAETAEALVEVARETAPASLSTSEGQAALARLTASRRGQGPSRAQTGLELWRRQTDRVRWKLRNATGLS